MKIFIVENHADTLKWLGLYLEGMGHTVASAMDMESALKNLKNAEIDVLISDIGLPDGDGWELLRRAQLGPSVYAIAMSGFGMNSDQLKSTAAGFRRHLLKPFEIDDLDRLLDEAAEESAARGAQRHEA